MRALIRLGIGLLSLLTIGSIANCYVIVSPVTHCPLGHAPDMYSVCPFYYVRPDGVAYGPYFYLRPPFPPQQGFLPGPIGEAIQSGFLPHELLMSKKAMQIGDMPLLKKYKSSGKESGPPTHPNQPQVPGVGPSPYGQAPGNGSQDGHATGAYAGPAYRNSGVPGPFPMAPSPGMMPPGAHAQVPYMGNAPAMSNAPGMGAIPNGGMPYGPQQMPYVQQMPYPMNSGGMAMMPGNAVPMMYPRPMPYPVYGPAPGMMPNGGVTMMAPPSTAMPYPQTMPLPVITNQQTAYVPYPGMNTYAMVPPYQGGGIWLVQNTAPNFQANPYMTAQPNGAAPFNPYAAQSPAYNGAPYPMPYPNYGRVPMAAPYGNPYPAPPTMQGMNVPSPYGGYLAMPSIPSLPSMRSVPPTPSMTPMPSVSTMPSIPGMPSMSNMSSYPAFQPYGSFDHFSNLRYPQMAQMGPVQMQLPRMDMAAPVPMKVGTAYPTHPFVRSPRDFFMWGDNMEEERARGNRPFPVP